MSNPFPDHENDFHHYQQGDISPVMNRSRRYLRTAGDVTPPSRGKYAPHGVSHSRAAFIDYPTFSSSNSRSGNQRPRHFSEDALDRAPDDIHYSRSSQPRNMDYQDLYNASGTSPSYNTFDNTPSAYGTGTK